MDYLRLRAIDPATGADLGIITDAEDISLDVPMRAAGAPVLSVSAQWAGRNVSVLETAPEVQAEVFDALTNTFVPVDDANFDVLGTSKSTNERVKTGEARQYDAQHVSWRNARGVTGDGVSSQSYGVTRASDGAWRTAENGPGVIRYFMEMDKARGWWPRLTFGFTGTTDSAGVPWVHRKQREFPQDATFEDILKALVDTGHAEYRYTGHRLDIFNPGTVLARDLSAKVIFASATDAPDKTDASGLLTAMLAKGENDKFYTVENPGAVAKYGRLTGVAEVANAVNQAQVQSQVAPALLAAREPKFEYSRSFDVRAPGTPRPFIDYKPGDWVGVTRLVGEKLVVEKARVVKINLSGFTGHVTLGTVMDSLLTRLNQRLAPLPQVVVGDTAGQRPTDQLPPNFAPDAPRVVSFSEVYISQGYPLGRIRLQWEPVTVGAVDVTYPNGTWYPVVHPDFAADCDEYRVEARRVGDDWSGATSGWQVIGQPVGGDFVHEGLTPGDTWEYRVTGHQKGAEAWGWSYFAYPAGTTDNTLPLVPNTVRVTVERDIIPPPTPSTPVLTSAWGTVNITWDGLAATGGTMPEDFVRVEVQGRKQSTGDTWVNVSPITVPLGFTVHGQRVSGEVWEYRFRAVDRSENYSPWSEIAQVTVRSIEDDPRYKAERDAAIAKAEAAQVTADSKNRFHPETTTAPVGTTTAPLVVGDLWPHRTDSGVIMKRWNGTAWVAISPTVEVNAAQAAADAVATNLTKTNTIEGLRATTSTGTPPTPAATTTAGYPTGATWTQINAAGATIGAYRWSGSAWVSQPLDPVYIPLLNVNSGTFDMLEAARLKAPWIQAGELIVGDPKNLIQNGDFAGTPWLHAGYSTNTITPVTSWASPNSPRTGTTGGAEITWAAGGNVVGCLLNGALTAGGVVQRQHQPVVLGAEYFASVWIRTWSGTGSTVQKRLRFYQYSSAGTYLGISDGPLVTATSAWAELSHTIKVTNVSTKYLVVAVASATLPTDTASVFRICDAYMVQKSTGRLIVDGSITADTLAANSVTTLKLATDAVDARTIAAGAVTAVAIAAKAVTAVKIDVASLAADTAFIDYLGANNILAGAIEAKIIDSDVFNGKVFNGGTFNGQTMNTVTLNGADINLISATYGSGKLRVQAAGSTRAFQIDANGAHVLEGTAKWVTLDANTRALKFFGAGTGEIFLEGIPGDLRVTTDIRGDKSNYPGVLFESKHGANQAQRLRAGALALQQNAMEIRLESPMLTGAKGFGSGVFVGYQGDQDAAAMGNVHPEAIAAKTGWRAWINPGGFNVRSNNTDAPQGGLAIDQTAWYLGAWPGLQAPQGYIFGRQNLLRIGINGQDSTNTTRMWGDLDRWTLVAGTEVLVGTNLRTTGSLIAASKQFEIVHPDLALAALGWVLRHSVVESSWISVEYCDQEDYPVIGADGTCRVTLPSYVRALTHRHRSIQLTAAGRNATAVSFDDVDEDGFTAFGTPGTKFSWLVKAERRDVPKLIVEEQDLDRAMQINDTTPGPDGAADGMLENLDKLTTPTVPEKPALKPVI